MLPRYPGTVFPNFLEYNFFFGLTPAGWKGQFSDFLARSGPWARREILSPGGKHQKHNFPVLGTLLVKKSGRPKSFCPKLRFLFYIFRFGRPDPHRQEIAEYWFFRPFWPRTALGT